MILYNVTVKIDRDVQKDWLAWMKNSHIPDVMATAHFTAYTMSKLLIQDNGDGDTFVMQYSCKDMGALNDYFDRDAPSLQKEHSEKYKDKFVAFRTIMKVESSSQDLDEIP